jgi:hypothetical protein
MYYWVSKYSYSSAATPFQYIQIDSHNLLYAKLLPALPVGFMSLNIPVIQQLWIIIYISAVP